MAEFHHLPRPIDEYPRSRRPSQRTGPEASAVLDFLGQMIASSMGLPDTAEKLLKISHWVHTVESVGFSAERGTDIRPMPLAWYTLIGIAECARYASLQETVGALIAVYTQLFPDTSSQ